MHSRAQHPLSPDTSVRSNHCSGRSALLFRIERGSPGAPRLRAVCLEEPLPWTCESRLTPDCPRGLPGFCWCRVGLARLGADTGERQYTLCLMEAPFTVRSLSL